MVGKNPIEAVKDAVADPVGTAKKAAHQAVGTARTVAEVGKMVADTAIHTAAGAAGKAASKVRHLRP